MTRTRTTGNAHLRRQTAMVLATALFLGNVAHAGQTEQVIFSAENALYGAGYDIGRADGWFDKDLRSAVRSYQQSSGLTVSGQLDNPTLSALGVDASALQTVSGNALASRAQSLEALGLPSQVQEPVVQPEPRQTVAQKPVVEETVVAQAVVVKAEQLAETPDLVPEQPTEKAVGEPADEVGKSTAAVVAAAENDQAKSSIKQPVVAETSNAIEEVSTAETAEKPVDVTAPEAPERPQPAPKTVVQPAPDVITPEARVAVSEPAKQQAPVDTGSTVAQDVREPDPVANQPRPQSSGGGFFSALFDFFFGWLV